jgi:hypothetical protein
MPDNSRNGAPSAGGIRVGGRNFPAIMAIERAFKTYSFLNARRLAQGFWTNRHPSNPMQKLIERIRPLYRKLLYWRWRWAYRLRSHEPRQRKKRASSNAQLLADLSELRLWKL